MLTFLLEPPQHVVHICFVGDLHFLHPIKETLLHALEVTIRLFEGTVRGDQGYSLLNFLDVLNRTPVPMLDMLLLHRVVLHLELLHLDGCILVCKLVEIASVQLCKLSNKTSSELPMLQLKARVFACRKE